MTERPQRGEAKAPAATRLVDFVDRNLFVILALAGGALLELAFLRLEIAADSWYSLVGGRFVRRSWIPHHDTLTIVAHGRDWLDQQWLGHLLLYGLWATGGWPLALIAVAASAVIGFAIAAATARLCGASARSTALVTLACFLVGFTNTSFRVQTPTYILFALVALLLVTDELRPSARVYLVFPLLVVWANVHGSVTLAAALVALRGLAIAWARLRSHREPKTWLPRAGALLVVPWLCTIASPYGLDLLHYYPKIINNPALSRLIGEWHATTIRNQPQFFVLLFGACWLAFRRGSTLGLFSRLALLLTAVAGLSALRHMVWFCLLAVAVLPPALDAAWPPKETPRHRRLNVAIAAAALLALVVATASIVSHGRAWFEHTYPRRAGEIVARAAAADPRLRIYADGRYADWLLFEHPRLAGRIAYDVRYELLTQHELEELSNFVSQRGNGWFRDAAGYRLLVLDPVREPGAIAYFRMQGARVLYRDAHVTVLERSPS